MFNIRNGENRYKSSADESRHNKGPKKVILALQQLFHVKKANFVNTELFCVDIGVL